MQIKIYKVKCLYQPFTLSVVTIIFLFTLNSCGSTQVGCPEEPFFGHIGQAVNTTENEYHPVFYENKLLFTRVPAKGKKEKSELSEYRVSLIPAFEDEYQDLSIPMKILEYSAFPSFTADGKEIYFAATGSKENKKSRDIYCSFKEKGEWSEPQLLDSINTKYYESQPAIAFDGSYIVFVSDRKGGIGKKDLYISFREGPNTWSTPVSLGANINSKADDQAPFIDDSDMLYYSSNGHTTKMGFDILKANIRKPAETPIALLYPANTESNETSCGVRNGMIYISSDRKNGCGAEDIFAYSICGPAIINGKISALNGLAPRDGKLVIENLTQGGKELITIGEDGKFLINAQPPCSYLLEYTNPCINNGSVKKRIDLPCSDSSFIDVSLNIDIKVSVPEFDFTKYEISFFPTGYYMPLTQNNVANLQQKYNYNIVGSSDETRYIINPNKINTKEIKKVEVALKEVANYLEELITNFSYNCEAYNINKIVVKINGYADPRPISENSQYVDISINEYGLNIKSGDKMDNQLLSTLRAYYTAKQIEQYLIDKTGITDICSIIDWQIFGAGTDNGNIDDSAKRRVNIEIHTR